MKIGLRFELGGVYPFPLNIINLTDSEFKQLFDGYLSTSKVFDFISSKSNTSHYAAKFSTGVITVHLYKLPADYHLPKSIEVDFSDLRYVFIRKNKE